MLGASLLVMTAILRKKDRERDFLWVITFCLPGGGAQIVVVRRWEPAEAPVRRGFGNENGFFMFFFTASVASEKNMFGF